jgi:hypothetical protein
LRRKIEKLDKIKVKNKIKKLEGENSNLTQSLHINNENFKTDLNKLKSNIKATSVDIKYLVSKINE